MTRHSSDEVNDTWYLDSGALRYICNNRELFLDIGSKNYKFIMIESKIIYSQKVSTIHLLFQSKKITIMLLNIIYGLKCNSNLILLE